MTEYNSGGTLLETFGVAAPVAIAVDSYGGLFAAGSAGVSEFTSASTGLPTVTMCRVFGIARCLRA